MFLVLVGHLDGGETIICYFPSNNTRYLIKSIGYLIS